jgi:hypothetical protein
VFAAISSGSKPWAGAVSSITFFVMLCSLLGIAFERGMWRVYWVGFATLGWGYLVLIHAPWLETRIGSHLLGPNLFGSLAALLHPGPAASAGGFQSVPVEVLAATATGGGFGPGTGPLAWWQYLPAYQQIGTSLEALLWAFAGGWVACYFAPRRGGSDDLTPARPATMPQPGVAEDR